MREYWTAYCFYIYLHICGGQRGRRSIIHTTPSVFHHRLHRKDRSISAKASKIDVQKTWVDITYSLEMHSVDLRIIYTSNSHVWRHTYCAPWNKKLILLYFMDEEGKYNTDGLLYASLSTSLLLPQKYKNPLWVKALISDSLLQPYFSTSELFLRTKASQLVRNPSNFPSTTSIQGHTT